MKIIKSDYKHGLVKLRIQSLDDLWYLSKIISKADKVEGVTFRKVSVNEKEGDRKRVYLQISAEKVEFQNFANILKILGTITESKDERIPLGDYHSFNIGVNDEVKIIKDEWTRSDRNYLGRSAGRKTSNVLLVGCDYGDASFAYYHEYGVEDAGTLSEELGGKKELKSFEKNKEDFVRKLLETINDVAKRQQVQKVLIGGASMITDTLKESIKNYDYIKDKVVFSKTGYGGKSGINELIRNGEVEKIVKDNVYSEHVKLVAKLMELIGRNGLATYGYNHVKSAAIAGAVSELLVTDEFIQWKKEKGEYAGLDKLMQTVEEAGGKIHIIPSQTEHGTNLQNLTGIAGILRYKIEK